MAQTIRIMHTLQDADELSKNRYVNTFYSYTATAFSGAQLTGHANAVKGFFQHVTSSHKIAEFMAGYARSPDATVKIYNVDLEEEHEPIYEETYLFDFTAAVPNLPNEVALCLSFRAEPYLTTLPQARQRGRVYIGPLNTNALASGLGINDHSLPIPTLMAAMNGAGVAMGADFVTAGGRWSVYSPRNTSLLGSVSSVPVHQTWVDNAWDIQRRRGIAASVRTTGVVV